VSREGKYRKNMEGVIARLMVEVYDEAASIAKGIAEVGLRLRLGRGSVSKSVAGGSMTS
jgi:hypothetical protein